MTTTSDSAPQTASDRLASPGPEHGWMTPLVGRWTVAMRVWPGPRADPRRRDNYRPLYQLAEVLGAPWPKLLEEAYLGTMHTDNAAEEMPGVVLLRDIWALFTRNPTRTAIRTADIVQHLSALEESQWAPGPGSRAITPHQIAQLLKPLGVKSHDKRDGARVAKCYMREDVKLAYDRYAAPAIAKPQQPLHD